MLTSGLMIAGILFVLGLTGVLIRRNIIFILMSLEVMLNAVALAFIVVGSRWGQADGQVMYLFIIAVASAEVAIGLALALKLHAEYKTLNTNFMNTLRG